MKQPRKVKNDYKKPSGALKSLVKKILYKLETTTDRSSEEVLSELRSQHPVNFDRADAIVRGVLKGKEEATLEVLDNLTDEQVIETVAQAAGILPEASV